MSATTTTKKFITVNGVRKINPQWHPPPSAPPAHHFTMNQATALPIVSDPVRQTDLFDEEIVLTADYDQAVHQYSQVVANAVIVVEDPHSGLEQLNGVIAKYEVPAGMLTKLLMLSEFEFGEMIVDDSSSMLSNTDAKGPRGELQTRWMEAKVRIVEMMELMAYVPSPTVFVRFLNRPAVLEFQRNTASSETPQDYFARVQQRLEQEFAIPPYGSTPALEAIQLSLRRYPGQAVLRWFLGDGVPNGGMAARTRISNLLVHRTDPSRNPFTFMSCTNHDSDTVWMKECEEVAPYCSEFDDYQDECREILKDQGMAFPYSFGLHLVGQIVAAFNPNDLDAMDESVPFPKLILESLMGYQMSPQEYKYYFDKFLQAQRNLLPQASYDQRVFVGKLSGLYAQFSSVANATDIPAVAEYKAQMKRAHSAEAARKARGQTQEVVCCVMQ